MRTTIIAKLDEADALVRPDIESAKAGMRSSDEEKLSKVRTLIQEAITIMHRVG